MKRCYNMSGTHLLMADVAYAANRTLLNIHEERCRELDRLKAERNVKWAWRFFRCGRSDRELSIQVDMHYYYQERVAEALASLADTTHPHNKAMFVTAEDFSMIESAWWAMEEEEEALADDADSEDDEQIEDQTEVKPEV